MSARACARAQRERRRNTTARPLYVYHHVCMYVNACMYMQMDVHVDSMQACVRVRACMCARVGSGTCAQGLVEHRARGAAGGGRLAEPAHTVSASAAAIPRPGRCAAPGRRASGARALRAPLGACARVGSGTCAQVRGQHRARGAAGGGRLAEPEDTVSAPDRRAHTARPMRRRVAGSGRRAH
jgi:hypothetical protein